MDCTGVNRVATFETETETARKRQTRGQKGGRGGEGELSPGREKGPLLFIKEGERVRERERGPKTFEKRKGRKKLMWW